MAKIPYQEALRQAGYENNEAEFLDKLSIIGISGYSAQLEGIEENKLKLIPSPKKQQLTNSSIKKKEEESGKNNSSEITIAQATKMFNDKGISATEEEVTDIIEILGYTEPFPEQNLDQIADLVVWGHALQVQETTILVDKSLAENNQKWLRKKAQQQGIVDAFVGEVEYSKSYLETRKALSSNRSKALQDGIPSSAIEISLAAKEGKDLLKNTQSSWINSSEQQQSQQQKSQENFSQFLGKRKSLLKD